MTIMLNDCTTIVQTTEPYEVDNIIGLQSPEPCIKTQPDVVEHCAIRNSNMGHAATTQSVPFQITQTHTQNTHTHTTSSGAELVPSFSILRIDSGCVRGQMQSATIPRGYRTHLYICPASCPCIQRDAGVDCAHNRAAFCWHRHTTITIEQ